MPSAAKPSLRFTHSKALRKRTLKLLDAIDEDDDPTVHREDIADHVCELTKTGMQFFFVETVKKLKMGLVVDQTAKLGVNGVLRVMTPTIRNIIGRMNKKQLRGLSKHMRGMME